MVASQKLNNRHYQNNKIDGIKKITIMRKKIVRHAAVHGFVVL